MAAFSVDLGGVLDMTVAPRKIVFVNPVGSSDKRRPSLYNDGPGTVILALNKNAVAWDKSEEGNKLPIPPKSSARIPRRCTFMTGRTMSGSATCWFTED